MASSKLSLKLLVDTKGQRVLFAEADKKTVDFLFHILTLPMATVIELLTKQQMVGSLANLYDSIENLSKRYIQSSQTKDTLLKPKTLIDHNDPNFSNPLFSLPSDMNTKQNHVSYTCLNRWMNGYCGNEATVNDISCSYHTSHRTYKRSDQKLYFSDESGAKCPKCGLVMSMEMSHVAPPDAVAIKGENGEDEEENGGFVKGFISYMVMDDLVVKPMSTISSIVLLNTLNVKDIASLEERVVDLGIDQALDLLKVSLASKEVLTTVFLKNDISK